MKTTWGLGLLAVAVAGAGCSLFRGSSPWAGMCSRVPPDHIAPAAPTKPAPAHPDFTKLKNRRNYYTLERVGAFEHHFAVWFSCVEPSVDYYSVTLDGAVRETGGAFGGIAIPGGRTEPVPEALHDVAQRVRDKHDASYKHASPGRVQYLGSYREIVINEVVPTSGPGDPYARMVNHATVTLRGNADLTAVSGAAEIEGGQTRMCWKDLFVRECGSPRWIDFTPQKGLGSVQLPALLSPKSPQPADERARFTAVALAAARGFVAGEPGAPLDAMLDKQGTSLLPPDYAPPITVVFTVYARAPDGGAVKQADAKLSAAVPTAEAIRVGARGQGTARIAGLELKAEVEIAPVDPPADPSAPLARDAEGKVHPKLRLKYRLSDGRGNVREAEIPISGEAVIDGDAVTFELDRLPEPMLTRTHDPPNGQHFPGAAPYTSIDTYFGISTAYETWWN